MALFRSIANRLTEHLARGPASSTEIAQALGVSQPTLSRALRALEREGFVQRISGTTRGARYGLRRTVDAIGSEWPVYLIDESGTVGRVGLVRALERDMYFVESDRTRIRGLFDGLPYYLQDARPAGFLGRLVPAAHPDLRLPARVVDWTDEHFLIYVTRRASDSTGDLIFGAEALDRYLTERPSRRVVPAESRAIAYTSLADAAMAGAPPGSSAQGEHPKFTACIADGERRTHMLVKFSPPRTTSVGQRWADLLVAEHLAHQILIDHGIAACRSTILEHADRVFLECERFDRVGAEGRRGAVSLFVVDVARYGRLDSWTAAAQRLVSDELLSASDAERVQLLDCFGALIANTDRHFGNVTLFDRYEDRFELAPVYDMLPMLFAPQSDQLVPRQFEAVGPTAATLTVWPRARALAAGYWERLTQDTRISAEFRETSARCLKVLQALPR